MIYLSLSELESLLTSIRDYAEKYRTTKPVLEAVEERWKKFEELAFAFGVELKPADGVEFYSGGPLPDNAELIRRLDKLIATVRRLREAYGDVKVVVELDLDVRRIAIKI